MDYSTLALSIGAGLATFFSPCAFMLPAYVSYYIGSQSASAAARQGQAKGSGMRAVMQGLGMGLVASAGILGLFIVIGLLAGQIGQFIKPYIPTMQVVAAVVVIGMGIYFWFAQPPNTCSAPGANTRDKGLLGMFAFGVLYGLAIVGCSAPVFLMVLINALNSGGVLLGALTLVWYGVGIALPVLAVTLLAATAREMIIDKMINAIPVLRKFAAVIMLVDGVYLIGNYYQWFGLIS